MARDWPPTYSKPGLFSIGRGPQHSIAAGGGGFTGVAAAEAGEFTPLDLFTGGRQGFWYDPSDLTTLFQAVNGTTAVTADADPVGYVEDKSGNGHEATRITGDTQRALYKTSGGLHWLEFDGTNDCYDILSALSAFRNIGHITAIAGILVGDTGANKYALMISNGLAANSTRAFIRTTSTEVLSIGGRRLDADTLAASTGSTLSTVTAQVVAAQFKYTSSDLIGRLNGVQDISNTSFQTDGSTSDTDSIAVRFGVLDGADFWKGRIYGLIVVAADLSAAEIENAEDWMATKCGISF